MASGETLPSTATIPHNEINKEWRNKSSAPGIFRDGLKAYKAVNKTLLVCETYMPAKIYSISPAGMWRGGEKPYEHARAASVAPGPYVET